MKFTVDRAKWRCGNHGDKKRGKGPTELLNDGGYRCCLGFVSSQCGIADEHMVYVGEPCSLPVRIAKSLDDILVRIAGDDDDETVFNSSLSRDAMDINDNAKIGQDERESRLTKLFAKHGHELEFVGEFGS